MTVREYYNHWLDHLTPGVGEGEAKAITREAFVHYLGLTPVDIAVNGNRQITEAGKELLDSAFEQLKEGRPIQYITGEAWFHGLKLHVGPSVLIPRPETSQLVDIIVDDFAGQQDLRVIDLCTGSGAIAIALSRSLPFSRVTAVEIDKKALAVAEINGRDLKCNIDWLCADVLVTENLPRSSFDIIVSNPPYIPEKEIGEIADIVFKNEPELALLVPDNDPIIFYKSIAAWGYEHLSRNGKLYFEINPHYAKDVESMLKAVGFADVDIIRDLYGKLRFVTACL